MKEESKGLQVQQDSRGCLDRQGLQERLGSPVMRVCLVILELQAL